MNLKDLEKVIKLVEKANISQLKIEEDGTKIEIVKDDICTEAAQQVQTAIVPAEQKQQSLQPMKTQALEKQPEESLKENDVTIVSPMVGTFYSAPSPDAPPFVKVGSSVKKGDTVCIIEAMKLFNEIESEWDGSIVKILVKNQDTVEFGQPLMIVKKDV
ncbi:MAG: acetyl-CoA carboxylase biotin carboxyl carrier protein [Candidatus Margulisbacteria bacterium]|nr:acetyl-CoA carboxylase biotin carboxyl carrier protein [Candidatus Margulisiibacteriota bacterium]